jgi:hypothetical protein
MSSNFSVNRSVINYIHARDYFPEHELDELRTWLGGTYWEDKKFGQELRNFNLIFPDIDLVLGKMIGDIIEIDKPNSGTIRKPLKDVIRFEDFEDLNDWRFVAAIEDNTFITYNNLKGYKTFLSYIKDTSEEKPSLDYFNGEDWEIESVIKLKPNDVLFYRPWVFHSFDEGMLHYYKLKVL